MRVWRRCIDALQRESFAAAKVRFSVIGFSDTAFTYLEPADLRLLQGMPVLTAQGLTSYASAFDQLAYRISVDIPSLKAQGYTVHRPAVFFLTDGLPNGHEDWRSVRSNLLAQPAAPNILAFGIGDADAGTVAELATQPHFAFVAARGVDTGAAISEFLTSLTQSVISSGQALAARLGRSCSLKNQKGLPWPWTWSRSAGPGRSWLAVKRETQG